MLHLMHQIPRLIALSAVACLASACGAAPTVEAGTGAVAFAPIMSNSTLPIVCGPQGGQHIWTAVRAQHLGPDHVNVMVQITSSQTGAEICTRSFNDVSLASVAGWGEFAGITCFITDSAAVQGLQLSLVGTVTDKDGHATTSAPISFDATGPTHPCGT